MNDHAVPMTDSSAAAILHSSTSHGAVLSKLAVADQHRIALVSQGSAGEQNLPEWLMSAWIERFGP
jgi:hypothetical protein